MNILKINGQALEGIYVDAAISFNKPAKRVSTYSVPGRNGDLVIDEGTFDNVLITYPVFEKSTFPTKFDEIVNWLASLEGYQRIECSNDPQHFRLGRFVVPQNPTAKRLNRDGYWQLSFDCKPQRWLLSGEEDTEIDANPIDEYSGDIVSFDAVALDEITELKANIVPVQIGTGDPSPTNVRPISGHTEVKVYKTGKNLLEWYQPASVTHNGVTFTYNDDGTVTANGTATADAYIELTSYKAYSGLFTYTGNPTGSSASTYRTQYRWRIDGTFGSWGYSNGSYQDLAEVSNADAFRIRLVVKSGQTVNNLVFKPMLRLTSVTDDTYEPFVGARYVFALGQTVYGGTLNVTTGVLTIGRKYIVYDGSSDENWSKFTTVSAGAYAMKIGASDISQSASEAKAMSNYLPAIAGSTIWGNYDYFIATTTSAAIYTGIRSITTVDAWRAYLAQNNLQVVYELATPTTVQLTAAEVELLLGQNNIWADTGDVEIKVMTPTVFNNPSLFNSKPLIRVYGIGTFRVNDITVTVASHDKPYIDIDCELQECYYDSENMNEYVSFSGNDFPELQPGDNYMLLASGITKLDVTPRWWVL